MNKTRPLSPRQRRQRNRDEMIAAITETARDIMREQGVAQLNLNEIARRLGMKTPSLYEYFPGKMALYDHLFRLGTRLFSQRLTEVAAAPDLAPWDRLERVVAVYLQCAIENPDLFKLVYERHVPGFVPSDESMAEALASLDEANRQVRQLLAALSPRPALTVEQMRDMVIAILHGLTALHLANHPDLPVGEGRFGSLIPLMIGTLKRAWGNETTSTHP